MFSRRCKSHNQQFLKASISDVLAFHQDGFQKGLSIHTLKRELSAQATVIKPHASFSLSSHCHVKHFLRSSFLLNLPTVHTLPGIYKRSSQLSSGHRSSIFQRSPSSSLPTTAFLVAFSSARRNSEFVALPIQFHDNRVVLSLDMAFVTKINSPFQKSLKCSDRLFVHVTLPL